MSKPANKVRSINRHHTKSGPGRYHGQSKLIVDTTGEVLGVREPTVRRSAAESSTWYSSYRESDRKTRERMASR